MIELDKRDIEMIGEKRFWRKHRRRAYKFTAIMAGIACGLFIWLLFSDISGPWPPVPLVTIFAIWGVWGVKMWRLATKQEKAGKELRKQWVEEGSPQPSAGS